MRVSSVARPVYPARRRTRTGATRAAAVGTALIVLAGCSDDERWTEDEVRESFEDRERLTSCGEYDVVHGEGEDELVEGWACLDAATGDGAELKVTSWTTEGDPIVDYYRVGPGIDGLEVFTDATADRFGAQVWMYRSCPDTVTTATPAGCHGSVLIE